MQIWDTAGTERYNSMGQNFYRNSEACVLVFDLTVKDSFTNIDNWRKEFLTSLGPKDPDSFPFVLVGNKSDMKDDIKVTNEEKNNKKTKFSRPLTPNLNIIRKVCIPITKKEEKIVNKDNKLDWERVYLYGDTFKSILGTVSSDTQGIPEELLRRVSGCCNSCGWCEL